jgi:hypothetical protein
MKRVFAEMKCTYCEKLLERSGAIYTCNNKKGECANFGRSYMPPKLQPVEETK